MRTCAARTAETRQPKPESGSLATRRMTEDEHHPYSPRPAQPKRLERL
jgi:hypothetical protein